MAVKGGAEGGGTFVLVNVFTRGGREERGGGSLGLCLVNGFLSLGNSCVILRILENLRGEKSLF
jgi:hypothetical protein